MKNSISILKFVNNPLSEESIALGLVIISNEKVYFKISPKKIDLAKKLGNDSAKLLDYSIKQLSSYLAHDLEGQVVAIEFKKQLDQEFIQRLSKYNNGILQFSTPSFIKSEVSESDFHNYYDKIIGCDPKQIAELKSIPVQSRLKTNMENKFVKPLVDRIDLNITVKKKQLPSLFFDFNLDGLGVNGSLYVVKSLDLEKTNRSNAVKEISEYESVLERLIEYSKSKDISGKPMTYLVMDRPSEDAHQLNDLYSDLRNEKMPFFEVVSSDELDKVSSEIIHSEARKFSPELLPA